MHINVCQAYNNAYTEFYLLEKHDAERELEHLHGTRYKVMIKEDIVSMFEKHDSTTFC